MAWTYAALATAIGALPGATQSAGLTAVAAAINAQTATVSVDTPCAAVEAIVVPTGEFFAIYQCSLKTPSGQSPPTTTDALIAAAWAFYRMLNQWTTVTTSNAAVAASTQVGLSALVGAGLLSSASQAAIVALASSTAPVWQPAVTAGDVQTALAQS